MKKPKRSVRRMIETLALAFGKHIGDQSIANVMRESPQYPAGLGISAGGQRQSFETDHRVAPPVGKPMIACDDRADFITRGMSARRILYPPRRGYNELIG